MYVNSLFLFVNMKVAIYCRLSEEDRNKQVQTDDSNSIQNQKAMLLQYAMEQGWEVYNIYSDDDYTGSDRRRPEFNRLLADAEAHRFNVVLCKTQSRFTRELELVEKYLHGLFPIWGIRFVSVVDNADTDNRGNKKSRQINGLVNEWYLEDMSENIRSVLTNRRQNGFHIGAFALYGYKKDPEQKGHLIIDEEAAAIVREVFTLFSLGYGKTAIARMLNDKGIPNPTEYKRLHGLRYQQPKRKNSTLWKYFAISDMLINEIYIGNMVQGKYGSVSYKTKQNRPRPKSEWYRVEGTHEPIIERELWDKVQAMIKERTKPFATGTIGLFARKARCANCGYTMCSSKNRGKHYLQCSNRHVAKDACIGSFISVDKLEQLVIDELNRLSAEYLDKDELEQNIEFCDNLQGRKNRLLADLTTYQKKVAEYSKGIRELYMDKVKGLLSESDYVEMSKDFTIECKRLEGVITDVEQQLSEIEEKIAAGDNHRKLIEQYTNLEHLTREIVETMIDYISIGKRIPGTRDVPIEIHWNF
jgi:DNA invertase Pin-like site-specific DNA recombinase